MPVKDNQPDKSQASDALEILPYPLDIAESISKMSIEDAIAMFTAEFPGVPMTRLNPYYDSHYANWEDVQKHALPYIKKCGIRYNFRITGASSGDVPNIYVLMLTLIGPDKSESKHMLPLCADQTGDPQKLGSKLTYLKRQMFCTALNIAAGDIDDDANAAADQASAQKVSAQQMEQIKELSAKTGITMERITQAAKENWNTPSLNELSYENMEKLIRSLRRRLDKTPKTPAKKKTTQKAVKKDET